jgi:hypothetical protein
MLWQKCQSFKKKEMNKFYKLGISIILLSNSYMNVFAGNKDRAGEPGAGHLLINPFAKSSGMASSNLASIKGIEAQNLNIAGLANVKQTDIMLNYCNWLTGTGTDIYSFGVGQRISSSGSIGFTFTTVSYGDIARTNVENPDGGIGYFSPRANIISLGYAKEFSNSIYGGINIKYHSNSITNLRQQGVAIDAGIQYFTGKRKEVKFGITLKNIGTPSSYNGDGLSTQAALLSSGTTLTVQQRSAKFDLPALFTIGGSYDYFFDKEKTENRLSFSANYVSNSYIKDVFQLGSEFCFKNMFFVRAGYNFETKNLNKKESETAITGICGGFSVELPFSKEKMSNFALDYSYRTTNPFNGIQSLGIRVGL